MAQFPRARRRARPRRDTILLACPRVSPQWELSALDLLMRPHDFRRDALAHRGGAQPWTPADASRVAAVLAEAAGRLLMDLEFALESALPSAGDFHLAVPIPAADEPAARGLVAAASAAAPHLWFTLGRLFVKNGRFHRRERGYKLNLRLASDVHVPREVRGALKGLL